MEFDRITRHEVGEAEAPAIGQTDDKKRDGKDNLMATLFGGVRTGRGPVRQAQSTFSGS